MNTVEVNGKHYLISEIETLCQEVEPDFVIKSCMRFLIENTVYVACPFNMGGTEFLILVNKTEPWRRWTEPFPIGRTFSDLCSNLPPQVTARRISWCD